MGDDLNELENYEKEELLKQLKVTWTYNSNAIEGNTLSQGDTSFIIESGLTVQGKSIAEHNQVIGHVKALDIIYKLLDKKNIIEEDLFLLHKAIQTDIVIDSEKPNGAYKAVPNGRWKKIEGRDKHFYYPHPNDTQHLMDLWFASFGNIDQNIQSKEEAVKIYTDMHLSFTSIHPFWDGNGRLARLVSNLPLLKNGFLPIIINSKDQQKYLELQFLYSQKAEMLDGNTQVLIDEKNPEYQEILAFFNAQYKNSLDLLTEIRESRKRLEKR